MPDGGQILRQAPDIVLLFIAYRKVRLGLRLLVGFLQRLHRFELLVPAPLQGGGYQAISRVYGIVLPLCQLRLVTGLTQLLFPLTLQGLFLLAQFIDHLHGQFDLSRRHGLENNVTTCSSIGFELID